MNRGSTAGQPDVLFLRRFPGYALHEKGLQTHIGVSTLVSSQEQRALLVPRLNRLSTAGQPRVNRTFCSSAGLHRISFFVLAKKRPGQLLMVPWGAIEGRLASEATKMSAPCSAQLRPARPSALRRADPPVVCPGFGLDRLHQPLAHALAQEPEL